MTRKKIFAAATALALAASPLTAAAVGAQPPRPAAEDVGGQAQFMNGFAAHWVVIGAIALAVLIFVVLDNDEDPVSP